MAKIKLKLRDGEVLEFSISDDVPFNTIVSATCGFWSRWIYLGRNMVVRKNDIVYISYESED